MKKSLIVILITFVSILCLTGCTKTSKYMKEINLDEFKEKMANKDSFAIYIGNENCSHCVAYKPTLISVINKYEITLYHLDNSKLSDKEYAEFKTYINISGTPTVAFITNGEEETALNRIVGETSKEDTIEIFKTNGYIK